MPFLVGERRMAVSYPVQADDEPNQYTFLKYSNEITRQSGRSTSKWETSKTVEMNRNEPKQKFGFEFNIIIIIIININHIRFRGNLPSTKIITNILSMNKTHSARKSVFSFVRVCFLGTEGNLLLFSARTDDGFFVQCSKRAHKHNTGDYW